MKSLLAVFAFVLLTAVSWGVYGATLHAGQHAMGDSRLRPLACVGLAYFAIAVVVPAVVLFARGEKGGWTVGGTVWSLAAGAVGALGALGVILAFGFGGNPIYVMPLVFGGAPVVNTVWTMFWSKSYRDVGPLFLAGLILVIAGAVAVLVFKPAPAGGGPHAAGPHAAAPAVTAASFVLVALSVAMTALCWGTYGPVLHRGQAAMHGSRLRPFMCVGIAYFLIAVLAPALLLGTLGEQGSWTLSGTLLSLAGGAAGAVGALGIILAFNFGGKPIYVMPLVFGGAPVVNTFTTIAAQGTSGSVSPLFYAGLIVVAAGAAVVLVFAPRGAPHGPHQPSARIRQGAAAAAGP